MPGQAIRGSRVAAYFGKGTFSCISMYVFNIHFETRLVLHRYTFNYLILSQIVREFEIIVEEELDLQFEFILAPKGPVSLGFRDRS